MTTDFISWIIPSQLLSELCMGATKKKDSSSDSSADHLDIDGWKSRRAIQNIWPQHPNTTFKDGMI